MERDEQFYEWLAGSLSNDENGSDEALAEYYMKEGELSQKEADAVIGLRNEFLTTPIMMMDDAVSKIVEAIEKANGNINPSTVLDGKRTNNTNMKITKLNYFVEYGKISKEHLSENFTKTHSLLDKLTAGGTEWSKVNGNDTYSSMAEKQFAFLEMLQQKAGTQQTRAKTSASPNKSARGRTKTGQPETSPTEKAAANIRKHTPKISYGAAVETIDPHLVILTRYRRMHEKTVPRDRITALARALVKQIEARILRKASEYSQIIEKMKEHLFEMLDKSKGVNVRVSIPGKTLSAIDNAINKEHQMKSVRFLRQYANMAGRITTLDKVKRLYKSIYGAMEKEQIPQDDRYYERVIGVVKNLKHYIEKEDERQKLKLLPAELSGILGCGCKSDEDSLKGFTYPDGNDDEAGPDEESEAPSEEPICSTEFMKKKFQRYEIAEPWVKVFGHIEPGKHTVIFSKEKLGKTTMLVDFAGYLSSHFGPVLFVQKEEELSGTFQDKLEQTQAANPNLFLVENLPADREKLRKYKFIFLDSVTRLGLSPKQLVSLQHYLGTDTNIFAILHATKDGQHRGANDYVHDAAQIVEFPEFGAARGRGRFKGHTGELVRFADPQP
ncbi:MAG: hypothetical protein M3R17_11520 [Bacteroidota bacterium]|nr:hypothetical protein [Bacteroidota bacterium]